MKEENLDRRIRKTRKVIRECLTELLKEKRIQDITVREIAEKADINRGTFYLHYKDIFDLMEQIENELLEELEEVLRRYRASDLLTNPAVVFTEVFHLVKENSGMVSILIGENGDINFVNRLKDIVREKCLRDWMERSVRKLLRKRASARAALPLRPTMPSLSPAVSGSFSTGWIPGSKNPRRSWPH